MSLGKIRTGALLLRKKKIYLQVNPDYGYTNALDALMPIIKFHYLLTNNYNKRKIFKPRKYYVFRRSLKRGVLIGQTTFQL